MSAGEYVGRKNTKAGTEPESPNLEETGDRLSTEKIVYDMYSTSKVLTRLRERELWLGR